MTNTTNQINSNKDKKDETKELFKQEFIETGSFISDFFSLDELFPEAEYLGNIFNILGYEPDNPLLMSAYRLNGEIITSADAGNEFTSYGRPDEKTAKEIEEALKKKESKSKYPTIDELKEHYKKEGYFYSLEYSLTDVFPEAEFLGNIREILGFEPENYYLMGVYRLNGVIHTSADAGNTWISYAPTDEETAKDIEEALKKKESEKK
ncbi:hypothetical protein [Bacillus cereus]|uniref:hypothetical protein n=1 Tax=Bacillus cereus TaxID=1396 RepID=UPI000B4B20C2|nr:hypothetical protein [Bacillus cereus]